MDVRYDRIYILCAQYCGCRIDVWENGMLIAIETWEPIQIDSFFTNMYPFSLQTPKNSKYSKQTQGQRDGVVFTIYSIIIYNRHIFSIFTR